MSTHTPNFNLNIPEDTDSMDSFFDDYEENMNIIDDNLGGGGGATIEEMTLAEYETLPSYKNSDGVLRAIKDVESLGEMAMTNIYAPTIYSDNERVIGVWRDNKPLYQKSFLINGTINIATTWTGTGIYLTEAEAIVGGMTYRAAGVGTIPTSFNLASNKELRLAITTSAGSNLTAGSVITVLYTKTADSAGSGGYNTDGVPMHHYSMAEQVVGTWLTGKPLYEKTIDVSNMSTDGSTPTVLGIPNTYVIRKMEFNGIYSVSGNTFQVCDSSMIVSSNFSNNLYMYVKAGSTNYEIYRTGAGSVSSMHLTIQYTKPTD